MLWHNYLFIYRYLVAAASFIQPAYTVEEAQGAVDVTLNLSKPVPFTDHSLRLEITDGTTSKS